MDTARDGAGRLVQHANRQELLFTTGQRSLTGPDNSRFVILEYITRRRVGELARARSNIEAKRFIRDTGSERGSVDNGPRLDRYGITCRYGLLFVSSIPDTGGPRACVCVWKRFERVMLLVHKH